MTRGSLLLPFGDDQTAVDARINARDSAAREYAVDPRFNVALESSAGTGKTWVLVNRYVNLLRAGVDPSNILAITFTRKAAAEMRARILATLQTAAAAGEIPSSQWRELRNRAADISISTIDAFCLSLLREFPLEADLDPDFSMADETEVPLLVEESLDRALRVCRAVARDDANVALVFAQLGEKRIRSGLSALLNRRLVAPAVLAKYLAQGPADLQVEGASHRAAAKLLDTFASMPGGLDRFINSGPRVPAFELLARNLRDLAQSARNGVDPVALQLVLARTRDYFLTQDGAARSRLIHSKAVFSSESQWRIHQSLALGHASAVTAVSDGYRRDLNLLVSRGVSRMFQIAAVEYRRTLGRYAVLDFSDVLLHAIELLGQMEEFAQSRYRLESRYHHVLVDEFQDTSPAQWKLISLLIQSWGEGTGLADVGPLHPSIFIVGDRKQSIYGFRDADPSVLREAGRVLERLRPAGGVRRSISRSFRSVPTLLSFVNDLCHDIEKASGRADGFEYQEEDRFPIEGSGIRDQGSDCLGLVAADSVEACAELTAAEIARLISSRTVVRDCETGVRRAMRPGDIAILFRSRESHREFEDALEARGLPAYVYKGLGFFDADEVKDVLALLWHLAEPLSNLRAAALLRSGFVRISDEGLRLLAPGIADALGGPQFGRIAVALESHDRDALAAARASTERWRGLVDRLPPSELLDTILSESAYTLELRGPRFPQAWENLKKLRGLIRRIQNRGYVTLSRLTTSLDRLAAGDESNAVIDAVDSVNLMTIHASKGLEFPVVFLVNLARGTGNRRESIRIYGKESDESVSVAVGDFQSEIDEEKGLREKEETKRLLYVAVTRARDRLYLGTVLKDARLQAGRGSLGEVVPASLVELFVPTNADVREWISSSGGIHRFRICEDAGSAPRDPAYVREGALDPACGTYVGRVPRSGPGAYERPVDVVALADASPLRQTISAASESDGAFPSDDALPTAHVGADLQVGPDGAVRMVGTLVHRMLHRLGFHSELSASDLEAEALRLVRPDERAGTVDENQMIQDVVRAYRTISDRADVRSLYSSGERWHEVPFTMRLDGAFLRGTIDCIVRGADTLTILEFKTGVQRPQHLAQVDLYRRAVKQLFPGMAVNSALVYANDR